MPSQFIIQDAFQHLENSSMKNLINWQIFCNSSRFSQITSEKRYLKSLEMICEICPPETTIYFRKLIYDSNDMEAGLFCSIMKNCFQLIDLELGAPDDDILGNLPISLRRLKMNFSTFADLKFLTNLKKLEINSKMDALIDDLPKNLETLIMNRFSGKFDLNLFPRLRVLEILEGNASTLNKDTNFENSEHHQLECLTIRGSRNGKECFFPNLQYFETDAYSNFLLLNTETMKHIESLKIPFIFFKTIELANELLLFVNLKKLVIDNNAKTCVHFDHLKTINIHDIFPNLEDIDVQRDNFFSLEFNHPMEKIKCNIRNICGKTESKYFSLLYVPVFNFSFPLEYSFMNNVLSSRGEIVFQFGHFDNYIVDFNSGVISERHLGHYKLLKDGNKITIRNF